MNCTSMRVNKTDGDFVHKSGSLMLAAFNCIGVCHVSENGILLHFHCRGHQFVDHKIFIYINLLPLAIFCLKQPDPKA